MAVTLAVLVTYYNEKSLLTECLESLRKSATLPDEILIHDDASAFPPEPYLPADLPVRIIRSTENRGPSGGRNVLLAATNCDYIHFHDSDDLFAPGWCDEVRARLEQSQPDVLFTGAATFRDSDPEKDVPIDLAELAVSPDLVRFCLSHSLLPACGTYLRERVLAIGGYSEKYWQSEDHDFHIRLALTKPRFEAIPRPLVRQRIHANNRSADQLRVWTDAVRILESAAISAGPDYGQDVCDALARCGRRLFQIGAVRESRQAFRAASRIGLPSFPDEPTYYRWVARHLGPLWAERVGKAYRSLLPDSARESVRMVLSPRTHQAR
jgi:hypothetical protein